MHTNKLKILLLSVSSESFFYDQLVIPFGLISLASYIDNGDYDIRGIEMNVPASRIKKRYLKVDKELLNEIKEFSPDIVAMSTYASNIYNVLFWVNTIKNELQNSFIIIGGNHASYIAKECLEKCAGLDMVIRFEGEIPFKMVCEKVKKNDYDFSKIPSISYRKNGRIIENPQIEFIKDLSVLPILNREYFKDFLKNKNEVYHADIITARGCPYNCTFCNCNHYWSKVYRVRKIEFFIKELKELLSKYPNLKSIRIRDESVTINRYRCKKLCDALIKNKIKLEFQAHSRLDGLDEEVIRNLAKAGFKLLFIGMESGSQENLNRLNKGIDISRAEEVINLLRKYGIKFRISFMSETPKESFRDIMKTIRLIKKLKLNKRKFEFYIGSGVAIYPGTYESERFLALNPDYEWLIKDFNFKGKYYGFKDSMGNILQPTYLEHIRYQRFLIRLFIEFILTDPYGIFKYFKSSLRYLIKIIKTH